jgi:hypothetical protein
LFRLSATVQAPLLVTRTEGEKVWGHVFTDPDAQSGEAWIVEYLFWRPSRERPTFLVEGIPPGPDVGEWEHNDARDDQ